ncbi:MAG: hypothetical protein AVDCRST_MAG73-2542 [uncultured Thermomicrobiales bacterium]|uniref:Membrane protein NfeD2 N-terminal transmembrane domain-containing protein n=1 Tax=uncultured Thermomicrobiales bacterium TaxID=1645740 RepID=A0A6J4UDL5_9BACT|nr:MAG: hypothetical protein AVDCRST_MAG73-2542 [uncultured Thermomicrobiales bacterium]
MPVVGDALDAVFLGAFLFGLVFSAASLLLGFADVDLDGDLFGGDDGGDGAGILNLSTILAFVAWFGGVGYLARHALDLGAPLAIGAGALGGVAGGALIAWFLAKVVRPNDTALDPGDFRLVGTLARVTSAIRANGIGEILYEQQGVRQVSAASAKDGRAIPRDTEVVVLAVERGVARVEPWEALLADREVGAGAGAGEVSRAGNAAAANDV